jgi:hypothetical protein
MATAKESPDDFRYCAGHESIRLLEEARLSNAFNSEESLCVPMPGDATGSLYRIAVVPWLFLLPGVLLILFALVYMVLMLTPWANASGTMFAIAGGVVTFGLYVVAVSERVSGALFDGGVVRRYGDALVSDLKGRVTEYRQFAIEDPRSYRKQKVISEDYGKGGLERTGHGLLIAGLQYQYVIRPQDVTDVRVDKNHVLITARVGRESVTLAVSPFMGSVEKEKVYREQIVAALRSA